MMTSAAATLAVIGMLSSPQAAVSAPAADPAAPTIVNGDFATVATNGMPASWSRWNPVGTATVSVEKSAAPGGTNDVAITSTSGATARLALTQSVPVTDATPRRLVISGDAKGDGLSGGLSELRVQVYDASNKVLVPVQKGPYLSGTFDWKHLVVPITLPVGAARVSVEPMLDRRH